MTSLNNVVVRYSSVLIAALLTLSACAEDGKDGTNGQDGAAGMNGLDGEDGANGQDGAKGQDGAPGANGIDGTNGQDGAPGADGQAGKDGAPGYARATFLVAKNGANNAGTIERVNESFALTRSLSIGNNEGIELSEGGAIVQAGDGAVGANLRTVCAQALHEPNATFGAQIGHELRGAQTGLTAPKGIALARKAGLILVADAMSPAVRAFGAQAAGDVAPVGAATLPANAWDLAYDEVNDRLYVALTNGDVTVHDDFIRGGFTAPTRTITPSDAMGAKLSINLHGIVYVREGDRLIVSDVGSAAAANDGQLFVINAASSASGNVAVARQIGGPSTGLGNPVDIVLDGADLRVAEKANDTLLVFNDIFDGPSGDVMPSLIVPSVKPESLVQLSRDRSPMMDVSDIDTNTAVTPFITASSNPAAGAPTFGQLVRMGAALNANIGQFSTGLSIESATFDAEGNAYITFDDNATVGGLMIAGKAAQGRDGQLSSAQYDRQITGPATGLVSPKGLDVSTEHGLVFVAENNATTPGILVFSACGSGDVAPLFTVNVGGRPWDVDFDPATGRMFVALTNGDVAIFDNILADHGQNGPDRVITPASGGAKISINLHGIDYDPASDSLFVSDVGSAQNADDGQIFVLGGASSASGLVNVSVRIQGPANPSALNPNDTFLGNPVDITYDGQHLYVAEKSNSLILRFNNILEHSGGNASPDLAVAFSAPESVALHPAYFSAVKR